MSAHRGYLLLLLFVLSLSTFGKFVFGNQVISLNGNWRFSSSNGSITGIGNVPGDIFTDLYNEAIIDNPLFGENHLNFKWISDDDWSYTKELILDAVPQNKSVTLEIGGLDTVAQVFFNKISVLNSTNQFLSHSIDIHKLIITGNNTITVNFKSPTLYATLKAEQYSKTTNHELPPVCPPTIYHGECHPNFIRKAQYSFAWDWGPSFPTIGITSDIFIEVSDLDYDFHWATTVIEDYWRIVLKINVNPTIAGIGTTLFEIEIPELNVQLTSEVKLSKVSLRKHRKAKKIESDYEIYIQEKHVKRWWPNGMGEQKMYEINVKNGNQVKTKKIGFRTVKLIQTYIDEDIPKKGRNFYFEVNNVPVYLKGSNWIPVSMFNDLKDNKRRMLFLIDSAKEVGMNVLRVWGGGFYETDDFYKYASENGILIWQDMMFACALYPTSRDFTKNVEQEISHQVDRLKTYPSILVFAGNNENEAAIRGHWWTVSNYSEAEQVLDYVELYTKIAKVVKQHAPHIPFVLSSPSNGVETESQGGVARNPQDTRFGDIHYYNEFVNLWRDDSYLTPRCASEYGIQSYPLRDTMLKWINESEWEYTSNSLVHRQHHPSALATNLIMIFSHLPIPAQCTSKSLTDIHRCKYLTSTFFMDRLAYFSQIHQAVALKAQTFHYRRFRNVTTSDGLGNTMCSMYWQLNDVWAAPTWSSIDFEQKWKMAHYEARRFFKDIAIYAFSDESDFNLNVNIINDNSTNLLNTTVVVEMLSWTNGLSPIYKSKTSVVNIPALSAMTVKTGTKIKHYAELSEYLYVIILLDSNDREISKDVMVPDFLFQVNLKQLGDVEISEMNRVKEGLYEITLTTDRISPFTWIECTKEYVGWFSDNGFHMTHRLKKLNFIVRNDTVPFDKTDFTVCNLKNCYV